MNEQAGGDDQLRPPWSSGFDSVLPVPGLRFNPWSGKYDPACHRARPKHALKKEINKSKSKQMVPD